MRSRVLAYLLPAACLLYAQQPAPLETNDLCRIEGRVVDSTTGEPVSGVLLTLRSVTSSAARGTTSGAGGRFTIAGVRPGAYNLSADQSNASAGLPLILSAGQFFKGIELKTPPRGAIAGIVLDGQSEPVSKVTVAVTPAAGAGMLLPAPLSRASTNDRGEFRCPNLGPGRYFLVAIPPGRPTEEEYPLVTYYPTAADQAGATPVELAPGEDLSGITIVLRRGRSHHVRGTVVSLSPGLPLAEVSLRLVSRERRPPALILTTALLRRPAGTSSTGNTVAEDGSFDLGNAEPGSYFLTATRRSDSRKLLGRLRVEVSQNDLTGVVLMIGEPLTISGTVKVEAGIDLSSTSILLRLLDSPSMHTPTSQPSAAGTFKLEDVPLDRYEVAAYRLPVGAYLKSVRIGGVELNDHILDLSQTVTVPPLELLVSPLGATGEGTVSNDEKPAPGARVYLIPDPARPESLARVESLQSDQKGIFRFTGVVPGKYRLYVVTEPPSIALADLEFFRPFESKAMKVTVDEGERKQVELKVANPPESR